jgi:D-glycero-alpha-D-manno-heptose 1-phosphate guanylyltransferase
MHKDCIILAQQKDAEGNVLCLTTLHDKSFLSYLAAQLKRYHICKVVFAVEKDNTSVHDYIFSHRDDFDFAFDFSETSLDAGTGVAVMNALQYSDTTDVLIVDSSKFFDVNLDDLIATQQTKVGDLSMALKYMEDATAYEQYHLNENNQITSISASNNKKDGLIDGGVYCIFRPSFLNINFSKEFSLVNDFIKKYLNKRDAFGMICESDFYDLTKASDINKARIIWKEKTITDATNQ